MQFIDLPQQYQRIKADVLKEIEEVLDSGQYIMGEKVGELESKLSQYAGVKHCIGVADGSKALLIALMALDVKSGDEVIVPAFSFFATASMVALLGATPVFVDIDKATFNIDPATIKAAITPNTKAIIAVGLFGQCADLMAVNNIAQQYNLAVIEDAAQCYGATIGDKHSCSLTTIACTSFFPSKPLGCYGDGGACFTNDDKLAQKMQFIRIHGQDARYHHAMLGVNGRLDTLQAGVVLAKLRIFDSEIAARKVIAARYDRLLADTNCITPIVKSGYSHLYAQYSILVHDRENFINRLNKLHIPTAVHYPIPLHMQPALQHYHSGKNNQPLPVSEMVAKTIVSIPMHPYLDEATQDTIVAAVKASL